MSEPMGIERQVVSGAPHFRFIRGWFSGDGVSEGPFSSIDVCRLTQGRVLRHMFWNAESRRECFTCMNARGDVRHLRIIVVWHSSA